MKQIVPPAAFIGRALIVPDPAGGWLVGRVSADGSLRDQRHYVTRPAAVRAANRINTPAGERARLDREAKARGLDLSQFNSACQQHALDAFDRSDADGMLGLVDNMVSLEIVAANVVPFRERGIFEAALIRALTMPRINTAHAPFSHLRTLIACADREKLRAAGEPLPGPGPFTVYRGVAGHGAQRRVRGFSWSASVERAQWFATRAADAFGLPNPAVYRVEIQEPDVLAYSNARKEEEFLVLVPATARPERMP